MFAQSLGRAAEEGRGGSMNQIRWSLCLGAVVLVGACTPFLGPLPPDGGDGSSVGGGGRDAVVGTSDGGASGERGQLDGRDASQDLRTPGMSCEQDQNCVGGHCTEGVCCDSTCSGTCVSCRMTNTGKPSGQCAPVEAGAVHGADCAATDSSTCGFDGNCDGKGACRKFGSDTICRGESCLQGTTSYSPTSHCDGAGTCVPQSQSCGDFKCTADGVRCRVSCAVDTDCATLAFCQGTSCTPKIGPGQKCSRPEQCTSSLCGGLCCKPGIPCKCTQPNAANVWLNPGFDKDAAGWTVADQAVWTSIDAEDCPFSGSVRSSVNEGYPQQSVSVQGGVTYNFGASFNAFEVGATFRCDLTVSTQSASATASTSIGGTLATPGKWENYSTSIAIAIDAVDAQVICEISGAFVDKAFLTPEPGLY
jgi:hypothetical protein